MGWVRNEDTAPTHRKLVKAGAEAAWLWEAGKCYCSRYLTDGLIPKDELLAVYAGECDRERAAERLVDVGLWEDAGDHYRVHDYHDYNPCAKDVIAKREAARVRMAKVRANGGGTPRELRGKFAPPTSTTLTTNEHPSRSEIPQRARGGSRPRKGSNSDKAMKGLKK